MEKMFERINKAVNPENKNESLTVGRMNLLITALGVDLEDNTSVVNGLAECLVNMHKIIARHPKGDDVMSNFIKHIKLIEYTSQFGDILSAIKRERIVHDELLSIIKDYFSIEPEYSQWAKRNMQTFIDIKRQVSDSITGDTKLYVITLKLHCLLTLAPCFISTNLFNNLFNVIARTKKYYLKSVEINTIISESYIYPIVGNSDDLRNKVIELTKGLRLDGFEPEKEFYNLTHIELLIERIQKLTVKVTIND